jgi:hypothetical protein
MKNAGDIYRTSLNLARIDWELAQCLVMIVATNIGKGWHIVFKHLS